jgi:hypothetical protein
MNDASAPAYLDMDRVHAPGATEADVACDRIAAAIGGPRSVFLLASQCDGDEVVSPHENASGPRSPQECGGGEGLFRWTRRDGIRGSGRRRRVRRWFECGSVGTGAEGQRREWQCRREERHGRGKGVMQACYEGGNSRYGRKQNEFKPLSDPCHRKDKHPRRLAKTDEN